MFHTARLANGKQFLAVGLLLLSASLAHGQSRDLATSGTLIDRVAAVVNDGVVLKSEVDEQVEQISARLRANKQQMPSLTVLRQQILERLVLQEIQLQRAANGGIKISDDMLNSAIKNIAEQNNVPFDKMPSVLAEQGIDYASYRDSMRKELTIDLLRRRDVLQRIIVTPRELDQYMTRQSTTGESQEFLISHILISVPEAASPEALEDAGKRAKDVYERAKKGEDFAQLAITYSASQTALEGGDLGWRKGPQLPQFISDIALKMQPGDIAEPVRTPSGFHLIKLNDKRSDTGQVMANQTHVRHILVKTNALKDDAAVEQELKALRKRIVDGEDFATLARTTSQDPGSAPEGGDLGWMAEGSFVPEFEKAVATLADNELSQPFKSQFGWHLAQLLGRRVQDVTDDKRRQQAYASLRESKADEETEIWLRRLRDEAFVETKM